MTIERPPSSAAQASDPRFENPTKALSAEIIARTKEYLTEISKDPAQYMDEGGAAWIYRLPAGVCMKVMRPHIESKTAGLLPGNTPEMEAIFQEYLSAVDVKGARSPRYVSSVRDGDFVAILMEEIEGVNLQKVLNGEQKLPSSFSHHVFFEALEHYFQDLHEREHILHGDLEPRNVMVDNETGMPRIIDFGRSKWSKDFDPAKKAALEKAEWAKMSSIEEKMAAYRGIDSRP
jgi:serine/threonine protein kinase